MSVKSVKFSTPIATRSPRQSFVKTPYPKFKQPDDQSANYNVLESTNYKDSLQCKTPCSANSKPPVHAETGQLLSSSSVAYQSKRSSVKASVVAEKLSQQEQPSSSQSYTRTVKYQVAKFHEYLLTLEEELKALNKGRRTLEFAIQETRKLLSVNQQSLSARQKKTRGNDDVIVKSLCEEARTISKSKRELESNLHIIKHQLHLLDDTRKTLQNKIMSESKSLQLDARNYKLYDGPIGKHSSSDKGRCYGTKYQKPKDVDVSCQMKASVNNVIQTSKNIRAEIKSVVASARSLQIDAHKKVNKTLSAHKEKAESSKRSITLQKGDLRLQKNSITNKTYSAEIKIGLISGPISEEHKSVGEKQDRPLTRVRPASAMTELDYPKKAKTKLLRLYCYCIIK
jgi:hypothetical protein